MTSTYAMDRYNKLLEIRKAIHPLFEELGYELPDPELGDYCVKTLLSSGFEMRISPGKNGVLRIETWDMEYPPDQGRLSGGYTIMPWISGNPLDLKDPNSLEDLKKYITNPVEFLGIDRDCCFADKTSPLHSDPEYDQECYHD